jgi:RNA-directed DNA polymerase
MPASALISVLARSLLASDPLVDAVHASAVQTLGHSWRWLRPLAVRYVEAFAARTRPRHRDVVRFLREDGEFRHARAQYAGQLSIAEWIGKAPRMLPVAAAQGWDIPAIVTLGDLADWLSIRDEELEWFADLKGLCGGPKLQHYHYRVLAKRSGGLRLTESPKPRLKELQRRILARILDSVPAHSAVHGFVKGRSIVSFAAKHTGKDVVLRVDLQDFFPTFPAARVQAMFRTLGYPESVADRLAGICTNAVPHGFWKVRPVEIGAGTWREARTLYARPHLPQGAPTSPAIANLTAYRLDCRLTGLARTAGCDYTRYADDLAFSGGGEFARGVERFAAHAAAIVWEEGFHVNHHKTRIMRQGVRQHLAGVVVNAKVQVARDDLKLLEAILTNCVRFGPESQNRERVADFRAHLQGRVGFVEMVNRTQGQGLRALLGNIQWDR